MKELFAIAIAILIGAAFAYGAQVLIATYHTSGILH